MNTTIIQRIITETKEEHDQLTPERCKIFAQLLNMDVDIYIKERQMRLNEIIRDAEAILSKITRNAY